MCVLFKKEGNEMAGLKSLKENYGKCKGQPGISDYMSEAALTQQFKFRRFSHVLDEMASDGRQAEQFQAN